MLEYKKVLGLRKLGIQISMDELGISYFSLISLQEINPDLLKLDQSFIKGLPVNQDSIEVVTLMDHYL